jgi:pimeloyl-ACP methyl ester carboxylesterase
VPAIDVNGLSLEFEDTGDPGDPVILLIMGLRRQMIAWPEMFVNNLVHARFRLIKYDNRDVGRSTWIDGEQPVSPAAFLSAMRLGEHVQVPYTLTDMASKELHALRQLAMQPWVRWGQVRSPVVWLVV